MAIDVIRGGLTESTVWTIPHFNPPEIALGENVSPQGDCPFSRTKVSVDTGGFVPGVHRINPYSVGSTKCMKNSFSYFREGFPSYYGYAITAKGPAFTYLANRKLSSYTAKRDTSLEKIALQKALGNVNAAVYDLGQELGEITETLQMLRHPLKNLRDYLEEQRWLEAKRDLLNYLRTGRFRMKTGRRAATMATSTWMEIRYGLRPLLMSIEQVIKMVRDKTDAMQPGQILSAKGSCSPVVIDSETFDYDLCADTAYCDLYAKSEITTEAAAYASVQYIRMTGQHSLEKVGLNWNNIPELAWELTRLSFVVDWFYGIGPWLSSLRIKPGIQILGNTVGYKETVTFRITDARVSNVFGNLQSEGVTTADGEFVRESYNRVVNSNMLTMPQFTAGKWLNHAKVIDLLAIAFQNIKF